DGRSTLDANVSPWRSRIAPRWAAICTCSRCCSRAMRVNPGLSVKVSCTIRTATRRRSTAMPPATAMMRPLMISVHSVSSTGGRSRFAHDLAVYRRPHAEAASRNLFQPSRRRTRRDLDLELALLLLETALQLARRRELVARMHDLQ